jgi:hypothetical protein
MTLRQQQADQTVARYRAIEHFCDNAGAAHIYKAKGGGWTLLASAGACIVGALTVGTYPTKQHAKTAANVLGLKAHNY